MKNPKRFTDILHGWYPDCSPSFPSLSPFAAEPNFFCHRNFAPLCMPPSPAALVRPSCFIRGNDGGAVNWQKPVILMTINNSGGERGRPTAADVIFSYYALPEIRSEQARVESVTKCRALQITKRSLPSHELLVPLIRVCNTELRKTAF